MRSRTAIGAAALALVSMLAVACDEDNPVGPPVGSIVLEPSADSLSVSETVQLQAIVVGSGGDTLDADVTFTSSAESVVTVSSAGLLTAQGPGTATITAEAGPETATATIFVREAASLSVEPSDVTLTVDETQDVAVTVLDIDDVPVVDPVITFSSSDETVATVDESGVITGMAEGDAVITVETEGLSTQVDVTVQAGGAIGTVTLAPDSLSLAVADTSRLTVTVQDTTGAPITDPSVTFSSQDTLVATVDGTGLVTGVAAGSTGVVAASAGVADTTSVTVQ